MKRETDSAPLTTGSTTRNLPTREQIAIRAYELFLARGSTPGNDIDDWLQAERELIEKCEQPALVRSATAP